MKICKKNSYKMSIEFVNPGIGDASYLKKHDQLLSSLAKIDSSKFKMEYWYFFESICGGYIYCLTANDTETMKILEKIVADLQFASKTSFKKGKSVDLGQKDPDLW